jgi:hypothetical protein
MHSSENKIDWQLVNENRPYSFYQYCGVMYLSENFLGCQQGNSSMKMYRGMEKVKSLAF